MDVVAGKNIDKRTLSFCRGGEEVHAVSPIKRAIAQALLPCKKIIPTAFKIVTSCFSYNGLSINLSFPVLGICIVRAYSVNL